MKLRDYILQNYDGNNAEFGRVNNYTRATVSSMVKKGIYYIHDGLLMIARKEVK